MAIKVLKAQIDSTSAISGSNLMASNSEIQISKRILD